MKTTGNATFNKDDFDTAIPAGILDFYIESFPNRKYSPSETFDQRFLSNPFCDKQQFAHIARDQQERISGQLLLIHTKRWYKGAHAIAAWGTDFFVHPDHRGSVAAIQILRPALATNRHYGVGLSELSYRIHLAMGERRIGEFSKFVKPIVPIRLPCRSHQYVELSLDSAPELPDFRPYWNDHFLEFDRSCEFMQWRFRRCYEGHRLFVRYDGAQVNAYFVVRKIRFRGIPAIKLVDYRCQRPEEMQEILAAFGDVARASHVIMAIAGSSVEEINAVLRANGFFLARSASIISNDPTVIDNWDPTVDRVLVTFADSDGDFL